MENYFNYFTEIEEHYHRRRGTTLLLSTLDWALIETWKNAGVPLEAVLRGIDEAFDKYDRKPTKTKKVNSLAYCSQAVLAAAEDMKEAAVGASAPGKAQPEPGFDAAQIATFLRENARTSGESKTAGTPGIRNDCDGARNGGVIARHGGGDRAKPKAAEARRPRTAADSSGGKVVRGPDGGDRGR